MTKKVAWDYIVPVKLPADLKGVTPGKLPESMLVKIPGGGKLHRLAANAWLAMVAKAKSEGIELKPTSSGDTYRTLEAQLAGFKQRYQLEEIPGASTRTYEGKKWYLKKGNAPLAAPGSSQHNLGIAVDVSNAAEPKRLNWLIENVKEFGFSWEVVPEEPWHLRYVSGDNVPAAVSAFAGGEAAPEPAAVAPAPVAAAPAPVAESGEVLDIGARGPRVRQLQQALKAKSIYQGPVDGEYSALLGAAVKKFKAANKLAADTKAGGKVFSFLGI